MRRALITGAGRGLGLALARELAGRGDRVFATARNPEEATELQDLEDAHAGRVSLLELDVTDEGQIRSAATAVRDSAGALDLLVNNAGIASSTGGGTSNRPEPLGRVSMDNALGVFAVNTVAPVLIAQEFRPLLAAGDAPLLVNVSSRMGSIEDKGGGGYYSYSASKAALDMMTRILSYDLRRDGVSVIAVSPGWVRTDMGGRSATLAPEQSAARLVDLFGRVSPRDSGGFFNYDGSPLPW